MSTMLDYGSRRSHSGLMTLGQSMTTRHSCPCCSNTLLRHLNHGELHWRCSHCWQVMPVEAHCADFV